MSKKIVFKPEEILGGKDKKETAYYDMAVNQGYSTDLRDYNKGDYFLYGNGRLTLHSVPNQGQITSESWEDETDEQSASNFKSDGEEEQELFNVEEDENLFYKPKLKEKIDKMVFQKASKVAKQELETYLKKYWKLPNAKQWVNKLGRIIKKKAKILDTRNLAKHYESAFKDLLRKRDELTNKRNIFRFNNISRKIMEDYMTTIGKNNMVSRYVNKLIGTKLSFNNMLKQATKGIDTKELLRLLEVVIEVM